jgi:hypothetical protein
MAHCLGYSQTPIPTMRLVSQTADDGTSRKLRDAWGTYLRSFAWAHVATLRLLVC